MPRADNDYTLPSEPPDRDGLASSRVEPRWSRELPLAFLAFLAISVWWLWPLSGSMATHRPDHMPAPLSLADYYLLLWVLTWGSHAVIAEPWNLFHANAFYPAPLSLAFSESLIGYLPLFAPTQWATDNPFLAANVVCLLHPPLRALALYALARRYVSPPSAAIAGILYGFQPAARISLSHFHIHGVQYLPLAILFTERFLDRARWTAAATALLALVLQAASSFYLAFAQMLAYGTYVGVTLLHRRTSLDRPRIVGLVVIIAGIGACMGALGAPYLLLQGRGIIPEHTPSTLTSTPLGLQPFAALALVSRALGEYGMGPIGWCLVVVAVLPHWRKRGLATSLGIALAGAGILFALGPNPVIGGVRLWTPYPYLADVIPGFSTIRIPARFVFIAHLGLALLGGIGLGRLIDGWSRFPKWATALVVSTGLFLGYKVPPLAIAEEPMATKAPAALAWLGKHGEGGPLAEWPTPDPIGSARRMLDSRHHWLPILDGYSGYVPRSSALLTRLVRGLPAPEFVQELTDHVDVKWVLVHLDESDRKRRVWLRRPPPGLRLVRRFGNDLLFQVMAEPARNRRDLLFRTDLTLDGHPRRRIEGHCPGRLSARPGHPFPWTGGRPTPVDLTIRNESPMVWPAAGVLPLRLTHAVTCWRKLGSADCRRRRRIPLEADILPGQTTELRVFVTPPRVGLHELEISLEQDHGPRLADCGVAPTRMETRSRPPRRSTRRGRSPS